MISKMKHHHAPPSVRPYGRLKLVGAGLVLTLVGSARLSRGVQVVTHWTGQPMFSWGLIAAGGLCLLPCSYSPVMDCQSSQHTLEAGAGSVSGDMTSIDIALRKLGCPRAGSAIHSSESAERGGVITRPPCLRHLRAWPSGKRDWQRPCLPWRRP